METTAITTTAPVKVTRLALYLALVAALAFANCAFMKAEIPENDIRLENWMLDNNILNASEQGIRLEAWMTASSEFITEAEAAVENWMITDTESAAETEVNVEEWMTAGSQFIAEAEMEVECWMTDETTLPNNTYLVRK